MNGFGWKFAVYPRRWWPVYAILLLSLAVVPWTYLKAREATAAQRRARFNLAVETIKGRADTHFTYYLALLHGLRGLFVASERVTPDECRTYLNSMELRTPPHEARARLPALKDLGFAMRVRRGQEETHATAIRQQGFAGYAPMFLGAGPDHFPIVYLDDLGPEPMSYSGWDPSGDPARKPAMDAARDAGEAVATGLTAVFARDPAQGIRGFILYLPVYEGGLTPDAVEERREKLTGFVFASIAPEQLWKDIEGPEGRLVSLQVFDGAEFLPERRLYPGDSKDLRTGAAEFIDGYTANGLGRTWTFFYSTRQAFEAGLERLTPLATLFVGIALSLGLTSATGLLARGRLNAERMTADLQQYQDLLSQEKERLRVALRSISDGVVTTDTAGRVALMNPMAEGLLGWTQAEALGRPLGDLFTVLEESKGTPHGSPVEQVVARGRVVQSVHPGLLTVRRGRQPFVTYSAAPIRDAEGRITGVVLVIRDVTEAQKLEAERLRSSKLESVGLLAGGIAHDFNNILTTIVGNLALARLASPLDAELTALLGQVETAAWRAQELTRQLLTFAKGGAPVRRAASLADIIRDTAHFALRGSNVRCQFDLVPDLWPAEVDVGQVSQVIQNLVLNALQAMPGGGTVHFRARNVQLEANELASLAPGPYVAFSVEDTGVGIEPEHLPRIFDPYFSTKLEGSGLGLATTYSIVRKHDGLITVESTVGHGSTFHVWLPAAPTAQIPATGSPDRLLRGQGRVLVVDDEPSIRELASRLLRQLGYDAESAADGAEALAAVRAGRDEARPFAAVILDLTIPGGMGGREAVGLLRQEAPGLKAIVSSGYSNDPVLANHRAYGFDGILAKPYKAEDLARAVHQVLLPGESKEAG